MKALLMKVEDITTLWLVWRAWKISVILAFQREKRRVFMLWQHEHGWPRFCSICGRFMKRGDRTLDHIIPQSICIELGLYQLLLDPRNFDIAHATCNAKKSSSVDDLPESVRTKIDELRALREPGMCA